MQTFKALQESLRSNIAKVAREYPKGKKVKVNNALKYNSLGKSDTVSGEVLDHGKDFLVVGIGKEAFNIKLKDIVKLESVGKDNVEEALKPKATPARDFGGKTMPEFEYKNRKGIVGLRPDQYKKSAQAKAADANPNNAAAKAAARGAATRAAYLAKMKKEEAEPIEEAASVDPKVAKAVEALNHLGYMLRGRRRFHSGVKRVETFFRSGNKKLLQGAIDVLDPDIRDDVMGILEPLGFVKNGVVESVNLEEKLKVSDGLEAWITDFKDSDAPQFKDADEKKRRDMAIAAFVAAGGKLDEDTEIVKEAGYKIPKNYAQMMAKQKRNKPSLSQNKLSSAEYQKVKKLKSFNKDDWKWNGDLYIRVAEDVEFDESTAAYAASLEKMANDKKLTGITPKDRETLAKLAAMMKGQRG